MASYRARATGNWSDVNTWSVWSGSAWVNATNIPNNADDVWTNSFVVTINQDITVLTLRSSTTGAPGTGTVSGGQYAISASGFTVTCTNTLIQTFIHAVTPFPVLIIITANGGTTTLNLNYLPTTSSNVNFMSSSGTTTLNINGNISHRCNTSNFNAITISSACTVNVVGTLAQESGIHIAPSNNAVIRFTVAGWTLNVTGNLIIPAAATFGNSNTSGVVRYDAAGTINVIGDCLNDSNSASNGGTLGCIVGFNATATITVTGTCRGGTGTGTIAAVVGSVASTINHTGICIAGNTNSFSIGQAAIVNGGVGSITILSGPFVFGNYGHMPFTCTRMFLSNNTNNYIDFATDSTNGALFPLPAPTRTQLVSPNTVVDAPAESNVRFGIVYANSTQTGTLRMAAPDKVAVGVLTDATVGTAALTPEDVWNLALSAINTPNSIGDRLKNVATVDSTGNQIASLLNT